MKRIIFILIIFSIICYFQHESVNKINNSYEILQYENPQKNIFENILQDKLISVFTNIKFNKWNISLSLYNTQKDLIDKSIIENLYYYNIPLSVENNHQILFESKDNPPLIQRQNKYRRLFYIYSGSKRFFIFNADQSKYLYLNNNNSPINLWKQDLQKYPLIEKAKYIEIICRKNTMLYIPYNFYYTSICDEETISIDVSSESIFSLYLKK
jgi:hypothetical protein